MVRAASIDGHSASWVPQLTTTARLSRRRPRKIVVVFDPDCIAHGLEERRDIQGDVSLLWRSTLAGLGAGGTREAARADARK